MNKNCGRSSNHPHMRLPSFLLLVVGAAAAVAQIQTPPVPQPQPQVIRRSNPSNSESTALPDNYVLTVTVSDKEKKVGELGLVVAAADFSADFPDGELTMTSFSGTLTPEDD